MEARKKYAVSTRGQFVKYKRRIIHGRVKAVLIRVVVICSSTFDGEGYLEVQRSQARVPPQRLGQLRRARVPDVVLYVTSQAISV